MSEVQLTQVLVGGNKPDDILRRKQLQVEQERQAEERRQTLSHQGTGTSHQDTGSSPNGTGTGVPIKAGSGLPLTSTLDEMFVSRDFNIIEAHSYFAMTGVWWGAKIMRLDLYKSIGWDQAKHTQAEWCQWMQRTSNMPLAPAPVYFMALKALYHNRNHADERVKETVEKARCALDTLLSPGIDLFTTSFVEYSPAEPTAVIVHPGGPHGTEQTGQVDLGPSGSFTGLLNGSAASEALTSCIPSELNAIWQWITGKTRPASEYDAFVNLNRLHNPPARETVQSSISFGTSRGTGGIPYHQCTVQAAGGPNRPLFAVALRVHDFGYLTGSNKAWGSIP